MGVLMVVSLILGRCFHVLCRVRTAALGLGGNGQLAGSNLSAHKVQSAKGLIFDMDLQSARGFGVE